MPESIQRASPLARFERERPRLPPAHGDAGVTAWERAFCSHVNLRLDPANPEALAAVRAVLGVALPLQPNSVTHDENISVLWLGPNEWLIVLPDGAAAASMAALQRALHGQFFAVTEVSGGQTIVVLRGKHVRDVLAKGCPLDLHPRSFGPGRCAQSHLAKAPILLHQRDDDPTFELIVRRSFADYLWLWLSSAADEYGFDVASRAQHPAEMAQWPHALSAVTG
jgi:sarcosine oxidase subunit gamma